MIRMSRFPVPDRSVWADSGKSSDQFYRSVFISDLHLCSRDCRVDMLCSFLDSFKCDYLYLVGDVFDFWCMNKGVHWPNQYNHVAKQILKRATKGAKVFYIPGNHDEFLRRFVGMSFGEVQIVEDAIHLGADGRQYWVLHGDLFDTVVRYHPWLSHLGGAAYGYLVLMNRVINMMRRWAGLSYVSLSGAIKRKVKHAVKFMSRFEDVLMEEAIKKGVDGVICGHIHQPQILEDRGLSYMNTGDWVESCTAVVEHTDGRWELIHWSDMVKGDSDQDLSAKVADRAVTLSA